MQKKRSDYSDRVWCTLLWEFMKYIKETLEKTATVKVFQSPERMSFEDVVLDKDGVQLIKSIAPTLFINFLFDNPDILGDELLIEWVKEKQKFYPFWSLFYSENIKSKVY